MSARPRSLVGLLVAAAGLAVAGVATEPWRPSGGTALPTTATPAWASQPELELCSSDAVGLLQVQAAPRRLPGPTRAAERAPGAGALGEAAAEQAAGPLADGRPPSEAEGGAPQRDQPALTQSAAAAEPRAALQQQQALARNAASASASAGAATAALTTDAVDMTWILVGMIVLAFLYALTGVCAHLDIPENQETLAERYAHALSSRWPTAVAEVLRESLPALSGKLLGQSADFPLLIPLQALEVAAHAAAGLPRAPECSWSLEILSSARRPILSASLKEAAQPGQNSTLMVAGRSEHGAPGPTLASISSDLTLRTARGEPFGHLLREASGDYVLEEASSGRRRWVVMASEAAGTGDLSDISFSVTWRPKGRVLATADRKNEYLKVMNSHGVDMVLVITCILGVLAFDFAPGQTPGRPGPRDAHEQEVPAARLLGHGGRERGDTRLPGAERQVAGT